MDKQDQSKQQEANRGQGPDRSSNAGNEKQGTQKPNIRPADRQEGEMNNGELGGNMGQKRQEEE